MISVNTIRTFLFLVCVVVSFSARTQPSILSQGSWYKMSVQKNGVYKISYDLFKKMGFDPDKTDPRKIKIAGNTGGMLPQPNSTARPTDLTENSIFVSGEDDGVFNQNDFILFYAEGAEGIRFDASKKIMAYEHNLYSDKNFYFITVASDDGKRITTSPDLGSGFPIVNTFTDFFFHELDDYSELQSGREWFGERFDFSVEQVFKVDVSGIVNNTPMTWVSDVMAQSLNAPSSFKLLFNNSQIGEQVVPTIPNTAYGLKGRHKRDTISFNSTTVSAPGTTTQEIKYQYVKAGSGKSIGFLDFFLISFTRSLSLYGDQTSFRSATSIDQPTSQFEIKNVSSGCTLWDVTDPSNAALQNFNLQNNTATFSTATNQVKEFIVFNASVPEPTLVGKISNQDLHSTPTPNLIVITHPDFKTEALRLAQHRQANNGWTTLVVTPEEVYHEFSSGRQDPTAFRDFTKYLYDKNPSVLKALLFLGRGSYDFKSRVAYNTNFVPTYESRNSLSPLETYSSDDYFGFLENTEGNWGESPVQNHTLDIGVGRLPVKSIDEARSVIDKIINYDINQKAFGSWRKEISFVADDGSISDGFSSTHQIQANSLANQIESTNAAFNTQRTFLGTYVKTVKPSGETIPKANEDIKSLFDRGSLIINYTGHGNETLWADEHIFTETDINELDNTLYPFMITATCEFGRQDDPAQISSAERCLIHPKGGAIGLVSTARPVNSSTNFELNQAFYEALLQKESNHYLNLGEIFRKTKNNSTSGVSNRNFSLLADPSLTLALPTNNMVVTELKTTSGSDTLKALSRIKVKGKIQDDDGTLLSDFNGTLQATLFDKQTEFITIGKNNPPFAFSEWYNALFRGQADVVDGTFEFEFILPKNMAYEVGPGKLSLYADDPALKIDAAGASTSFSVGGSEPSPAIDNIAPTLQAFIGDTTFLNGGVTNPNTTLLVRLHDAGGINISSYGIGNNLMAILDNGDAISVNDYYRSNPNDFTTGWINFPLHNLSPGKHTITVKAWDTSNNGGQTSINFVVTDGEAIVIEQFGNYPNPFDDKTTFFFTHNRSGDDLEIELSLYSAFGQEMKTYQFSEISSPYQVTFPELDTLLEFGKKLAPGLYLARLAIRSLTNGSKYEQVTKLIVVY